ncbi:MAG TPA: beta-ketoacyl synthase N-terminal-like domain-containing protein [Methylomirabilota bacterium]|nr:beta-ketoacyl synthase N-terminal-like domain-containing protein [Methylomirabilota bacterium]
MKVAAVGVLTGWGEGISALPDDARRAAAGRTIVTLPPPAAASERFRRATRECRLGVAAVDALLRAAALDRETLHGAGTALVYVTAGAYGASNRAFIDGEAARGGALHFPYTAPSAVPAEVTIEFGITGPYVTFIGGAAAAIDALWHADRLLAGGACQRALVLAVETVEECASLWARGRWLVGRPLVEAAACALLLPGAAGARAEAAGRASALETTVRRRSGETLACAPLIGLALALESGEDAWNVTEHWRGHRLGFDRSAGPNPRAAAGGRTGRPWSPRKCSTS